MAVKVSITLHGDEHFVRTIRAMRFRSMDMEPVLDHIGEDWIDIVEEQFGTEGGRLGKKWAALKLDTKIKRGSAHPILIDSGDMFQEFITPSNVKVTHDNVTYELPDGEREKAEAHQYGFVNAHTGRPVPARPIVGFTAADRLRYRNWITDYLVNGRLPA